MSIKRNKRERKMLKWSKMKKSEFQHVVYATVETIPSVLRRRSSVHRHVSQGSKQASVNKSRVALPPATVRLCHIGLVCVWKAGFRGHSFLFVRTAWGRAYRTSCREAAPIVVGLRPLRYCNNWTGDHARLQVATNSTACGKFL